MAWKIYLFFTVLFWGGYNILYRFAVSKIDYALLLCIIGIVHAVTAVPWVAYNYFNNKTILCLSEGVLIAVIMGILLTLGGITFTRAFSMGIPVSVATPAYSIGVMVLSALAGIILGEAITLKWFFGMLFGAGSILLLTIK